MEHEQFFEGLYSLQEASYNIFDLYGRNQCLYFTFKQGINQNSSPRIKKNNFAITEDNNVGNFTFGSIEGFNQSCAFAGKWVLIYKNVGLEVDGIDGIFEYSDSDKEKLYLFGVLHILRRASLDNRQLFHLDVPNLDQLV